MSIGSGANQPIVIDNGSGIIKVGFAGVDKPRLVFRNFLGRTKHVRVMPGGALEGTDILIGNRAEEHRGSLVLSYPIEHGIIQNWSDMEKIWSHIYSKENLNVPSDEHNVLLTEAPLNPYRSRDKMAEFFFENLNVPALYFAMQAILSLYASGRTTGLVLDSGDGVTHACPIYEGFALPHAITRLDLAGRDVTNQLQLLLRRSGHVFNTTAEFEIVRQIKEAACRVSFNPNDLDQSNSVTYPLPDGSVITLGNEILRAPEILFQPSLIGSEQRGVHDCLVKAIMKSDIDLRRNLFTQIVVAGGNTQFTGFCDRLLQEVRKHPLSPKETKIRIAAPPDRIYTTWIGGSILASLSTFKNMWIQKSDYLEQGNRILHAREI
jgi:centractin